MGVKKARGLRSAQASRTTLSPACSLQGLLSFSRLGIGLGIVVLIVNLVLKSTQVSWNHTTSYCLYSNLYKIASVEFVLHCQTRRMPFLMYLVSWHWPLKWTSFVQHTCDAALWLLQKSTYRLPACLAELVFLGLHDAVGAYRIPFCCHAGPGILPCITNSLYFKCGICLHLCNSVATGCCRIFSEGV